jgi:ABC-type nitrate/sulfonate/bicarbonate transport system permease component
MGAGLSHDLVAQQQHAGSSTASATTLEHRGVGYNLGLMAGVLLGLFMGSPLMNRGQK